MTFLTRYHGRNRSLPPRLRPRHRNHKPVQFVAHHDLAGEAGGFAEVEAEVEHVFFLVALFAVGQAFFPPVGMDIKMAGGAGEGAAARAFDLFDIVFQRDFHHREAVRGVYDLFGAVFQFECDLWHSMFL